MTVSTFQKLVGTEPFRLIPRCVITQASGKQRVIDDAYVGLQSERSSDANKLVLCSASSAASATSPVCLRLWTPAHRLHGRMGIGWRRLARCLSLLPNEQGRGNVLCRHLSFITNDMSLQSCCIQDSCLGYLWQLHHSTGIVVWWKLWQGDFCFA